ncbi:MAG: hypothetical protein KGL39_45815 [Patescibacteria group bacterium]|nr:hypothetical protein [Patescibacteria group bacterium]
MKKTKRVDVVKPPLDKDAAVLALLTAAKSALAMFRAGHALSGFNWGASALSAAHIEELNEVPGALRAAICAMEEIGFEKS